MEPLGCALIGTGVFVLIWAVIEYFDYVGALSLDELEN